MGSIPCRLEMCEAIDSPSEVAPLSMGMMAR